MDDVHALRLWAIQLFTYVCLNGMTMLSFAVHSHDSIFGRLWAVNTYSHPRRVSAMAQSPAHIGFNALKASLDFYFGQVLTGLLNFFNIISLMRCCSGSFLSETEQKLLCLPLLAKEEHTRYYNGVLVRILLIMLLSQLDPFFFVHYKREGKHTHAHTPTKRLWIVIHYSFTYVLTWFTCFSFCSLISFFLELSVLSIHTLPYRQYCPVFQVNR